MPRVSWSTSSERWSDHSTGLVCLPGVAPTGGDQESTSRGGRGALPILLVGAAAIAFAPVFVRLSELGPTATAFHRLFLALPVLWIWLASQSGEGRKPTGLRDLLGLALAGLLFAADLAVWHWSIHLTSVANATLLANFAPVFVTFGAWLIFKERVTAVFLAALVMGVAGVGLLMGDSLSLGGRSLVGDALGLLTAIFYGGYILAVSRLRRRFSTVTIMAWSGSVTCLALLPVALLSGETIWATTATGWAVLIALAFVSHAGGQSLIAYALAHLPAAFSSVSLLLQPVIAAALAWIILAEPMRPVQALGAIIVLLAIVLARRGSR